MLAWTSVKAALYALHSINFLILSLVRPSVCLVVGARNYKWAASERC